MRMPLRALVRHARPALFGLALIAVPARAADLPTETALPASTVALLKIANAAELRAAIEQTQFGQMIADPAMKPLKDDVAAKLDDRSDDLRKRLGVTIQELAELPQGAVWIAVLRREAKVPMSVLIAADAGANAEKMAEVMAKATKQAEQQGNKVATESFKDLTITVIRPADAKDDDQPLAWTRQGSGFLIGTDPDALKDLIANAAGRTDSLVATEGYATVVDKVGKDAPFFWYLDLGQVVRLGTQAAADQGGDPQQAEAMLQLLGINSLKAVGGTLRFNTPEYDSVSKIFISSPGPAQGLARLFPMPRATLRPEPWVPATAASYQTVSWDLDTAFTGLNDLVNMFAPGALENLEKQLVGPNGGQGLSFEKDLFGPLGDRVTVVSDFKKPITEVSQRALFAVALEDPKAFQTSLNKLFNLAGVVPKKRDFQGTTIYDLDLSEIAPPGGAGAGADPGTWSLAIAKDYLLASDDPTLLEQVLRSGAPALAETPEFLAVLKQVPGEVSSFSYAKAEEQARLTYDMIKNGTLQQAIDAANQQAGGPQGPKLDEIIDPAKLPEFSVFAKYLAPGGGFSTMDEQGVTITNFSLRKSNP